MVSTAPTEKLQSSEIGIMDVGMPATPCSCRYEPPLPPRGRNRKSSSFNTSTIVSILSYYTGMLPAGTIISYHYDGTQNRALLVGRKFTEAKDSPLCVFFVLCCVRVCVCMCVCFLASGTQSHGACCALPGVDDRPEYKTHQPVNYRGDMLQSTCCAPECKELVGNMKKGRERRAARNVKQNSATHFPGCNRMERAPRVLVQ